MKPFLIVTNLLSLCVIAWLLYPKKPTPVRPIADTTPCGTCPKDSYGHTFAHFKDVVSRYRTERWDSINANKFSVSTAGQSHASLMTKVDSTDARTIWFSLDTIKQFICTIEKYNNQLTSKASGMGLRFYYAVYPQEMDNALNANRHTLFIVPTFRKANGSNVDFDPRQTYTNQVQYGRSELVTLVSLSGSSAPILALAPTLKAAGSGNSNTIQNNGELCPAYCPDINTLSKIDN